MIVPVGAVGGSFSLSEVEGLGAQQAAGGEAPSAAAGLEGSGQGSSGAVEGVGAGEGAGGAEAVSAVEEGGQAGQPSGSEGGGPTSFGSALTEAISSLEQAQSNAGEASRALATGTVKDPESAIVTVEDAALAMQLAAQIRTKATEAVQTIFQTQV